MKLKLLTGIVAAAVLGAATPALADRGHGHGHWKKQHHGKYYRDYEERVYHYYSYSPPPVRVYERRYDYVYTYAPPAPGIHVVLPNVYIPLR